MIKSFREKYNSEFKEETYQEFLSEIRKASNSTLDFRVCETPLFADENLTNSLIQASEEILEVIKLGEVLKGSEKVVPERFNVPNEDTHPIFLQLDFGISKDLDENLVPQLIELQGFPSLYCFQAFLDLKNRQFYNIPENLTAYFNGFTYESYLDLLKKSIIGDSETENVVLLEIEPEQQKTYIDFLLTEKMLGVKPICISEVKKEGNKLYYNHEGRKIRIDKIYNRVIIDELVKKDISYSFDFRDNLDVKWIGHPNWFFKISKYLLPKIKTSYTPDCYFLNELESIPDDLHNFVLKPLFSFSGQGVQIDLNKKILSNIKDKDGYILQRKVEYTPLIKTPDVYSKTEVRMMFIWDDEPILVNNLLRTTKGKMVGVDFNKNKTWVGSNIVYHY